MSLAGAGNLGNIRTLKLDTNPCSSAVPFFFQQSDAFPALETLSMTDLSTGEANDDGNGGGAGIDGGNGGDNAVAVGSFPKLTQLSLSTSTFPNPSSLSTIFRHIPNIDSLNLTRTGLDPKSMAAIVPEFKWLSKLTTLALSSNPQLASGGAIAVSNSPNLSHLQLLMFYGCGIGNEGAIALTSATQTFPLLKLLDLRANYGLDDDTKARITHHTLPQLESLFS